MAKYLKCQSCIHKDVCKLCNFIDKLTDDIDYQIDQFITYDYVGYSIECTKYENKENFIERI